MTGSSRHTRGQAEGARSLPGKLLHIVKRTVVELFRYRVTGLAAEAAFWALLSLPPLVLGLIGALGYLRSLVGEGTLAEIEAWIITNASHVLSASVVKSVVTPIINDVLSGGRADIISVSFLISLWSGSRALNVYVDTITIAYGLAGYRGIVKTRTLSFSLYLVGLGVGVVVIPLIVAGPTLVRHALPGSGPLVSILYWPVVVALSVTFLTTLYHVSVPVRTPWWRDLPGSVLALAIWVVGSLFLRIYLGASLSGVTVYGSLAAPIAVLAWLYVTALAVLIGAALNAEIDKVWPTEATVQARGAGPRTPSTTDQIAMRAGDQNRREG